ncbi:transposable element Tc3 transposase [Trichonephila clavipes]|uniref:Transposable element Tc3 transposase n=1 Tax=Trichonephila clavipes TaxID=2585209 RepID=A0A8X6RLQ2_TRICX|nr:transposable element Tc3 transposase [Trichonephila clavipes]
MDVCKCVVPLWYGGTKNSRRVSSPLVRLVEEEDKWEASKHPQDNLVALHFKCDQARRRFVEWAQNEIVVVPNFHKRILLSDEAHFWLNGYVNKQNCRIWSEVNPQVYIETPLHPEKLTVWCALWAGGPLLQKRRRPQRYSQW